MKKLLVLLSMALLAACSAPGIESTSDVDQAVTGSTTLVNGLSPFVSADLTTGTTVIPTRTQGIGTALGILAVMEADRVNLPASQGGGFKVIALVGTGITQTHDQSIVSWSTYTTDAGGPVAFPPNPQPTGVSAFLSADVTSTNVVEATHATKTGGCLGVTLEATNRVNAPASQGGGFKVTSFDQAHHVRTCDTSSFRWAVH